MAARLNNDERLRRAVAAFLRHTEGHGGGFRCVHCKGFRDRMADALDAALPVPPAERGQQ